MTTYRHDVMPLKSPVQFRYGQALALIDSGCHTMANPKTSIGRREI